MQSEERSGSPVGDSHASSKEDVVGETGVEHLEPQKNFPPSIVAEDVTEHQASNSETNSNSPGKTNETTDLEHKNPYTIEVSINDNPENDTRNDARDEQLDPGRIGSFIVFVDPTGSLWNFPFEACRRWEEMKKVVKRVFVDCFPSSRYSDLIDNTDNTSGSFSIIRVSPEMAKILPEHWDAMVQPGWKVKIQFQNDAHVLEAIRRQQIRDKRPKTKTSSSKTGNKPLQEEEPVADVSYVVNFYEQGRFGTWESAYTMKNSGPITFTAPEASQEARSILEDHRKVFRKTEIGKDSPDRGKIGSADTVHDPTLFIHSTTLLDALKAVIEFQSYPEGKTGNLGSNPATETTDLSKGVFVHPFRDLFHHKDALIEYKKGLNSTKPHHSTEYNQTCRDHIDVLIQYLYAQPTIPLKEAEAAWSQENPKTAFSWIWLLLKPGTDVVVRDGDGELNVYVIESFYGGNQTGWACPYDVLVWNLEFDGQFLTRNVKRVPIPLFDGERDIHSLPLYPIRFHKGPTDAETLCKELVERGKSYVEVIKSPSFREYTGRSHFQGVRKFNRSRVVVDHTSKPWTLSDFQDTTTHEPGTKKMERLGSSTRIPGCPCTTCESLDSGLHSLRRRKFDEYDTIDLSLKEPLTEHQYLLCWSHVYAFILKDRCWDLVLLCGLKPPKIDKDVIDTLVMRSDENKSMIKAICETFNGSEAQNLFFADFIQGKGEGQILLLHGPPGTGKTLTAESVAEWTGRPLLSITAADLGHEPEDLEKKLLRFFRNANKWDAIVLLDEADVYLERRSTHDLQRNSIVSVFLRALDYFQGILFLTTNRVGCFDEAFMSRIHVQIGYDVLDDKSRIQIWKNHFRKLTRNHDDGGREIQYSITAMEYVEKSAALKNLEWNGREIRNAFQTAVALASFHARQIDEKNKDRTGETKAVPKVTDDHIDQVVKMSQNFKRYMKDTLQSDDANFALQHGIRSDKTRAT